MSSSSLLGLLRRTAATAQAQQVHAQFLVRGLPLHNHLLSKLSELCSDDYALAVFLDLPSSPNDHSYASLIRAYAASGLFGRALASYSSMLRNGVQPTNFTYPPLLKSCSALSSPCLGRQMHAHVLKFGFLSDLFVSNCLIDMYSKCLLLENARQLLEDMPNRDYVSYNTLISGYAQNGDMRNACLVFEEMPTSRNVVCWTALIDGFGKHGMIAEMLIFFRRMLVSGDHVLPNSATMVCLLSACAKASNWEAGRWISVFIDVNAITLNSVLSTALVDMYSRCGELDKARKVFDDIPDKNVVSWNAMITGYLLRGLAEYAVRLYHSMKECGVEPNELVISSGEASLGCCKLLSNIFASVCRWSDVARVRKLIKEKTTMKVSSCSWIEVDGDVCRFLVEDIKLVKCQNIYVMLTILMRQLSDEGYQVNFDNLVEHIQNFQNFVQEQLRAKRNKCYALHKTNEAGALNKLSSFEVV
ncbi:hypothetical protein Cni_G24973 [Canna indica]|uniref:Pentatricopeptide repeat-containing protein n=1 Tax=Canna indica TaxID=4628 RepID=A0AAQ3QKM6_9LILI|nr:hypothetical protein Cni_G24973 [Canna indica]